ncbi:glutathione S-transferas-like protein [Chaetomium sp. MPI-CAGE-AT-0009]|nr:glutathione S-transferas-like protein [Chaetomium sp. MPI-CAGE-AT-0009]
MGSESPKPITFYDIGSGPCSKPFAPNPWKTRFALNFCSVPYTTVFVPLPSVAATRASLNMPPVRKHADGSDFPTLPIIHDHALSTLVGDSFDIALHLHTHYPTKASHPLFPPNTIPLHRAFNAHADNLFASHGAPLAGYWLPFDPATAEQSKKEMLARFGMKGSWEDLKVEGEARVQKMAAFEEALGGLAGWFVKREEGPFLEGAVPMYADLVVGGWLMWLRLLLPGSEWEVLRGWHGGVWGRLADALEVWAGVEMGASEMGRVHG